MNRRAHQVLLPADSIVSTLECLGLCHGDDVFAVRLACGLLSVCGMRGHSLTLAILLILGSLGIHTGFLAILSALLRALPAAVGRCRLLPKDFLLEGRDVLLVLLRLVDDDETLGLIVPKVRDRRAPPPSSSGSPSRQTRGRETSCPCGACGACPSTPSAGSPS